MLKMIKDRKIQNHRYYMKNREIQIKTVTEYDRKNPVNKKIRRYKYSAKMKKIDFQLNYEEFKEFVNNECFYCGFKNTIIINEMSLNGIDRINSDIGYIKENCVSCCKWCNWAKNVLSQKDFFALVTKIYNKCCRHDLNVGIH